MDPLQAILGVKLSHMVAGFFGGLVKALISPEVKLMRTIFSCIAGAMTAGYMTPIAIHYIPFAGTEGAEGAIGYVIGLTAMVIVERLANVVKKWRGDQLGG
jgi:predicted permease